MTPAPTIEPNTLQSPGENPERQLHFLLHSVGVSPIEDLGWIRVTGSDRVRWLNGMVTNSIQTLRPGEGNYSFALNAQGQIQGDLNAFAATDDSVVLQTTKERVAPLMAIFDRFIIMDDVELQDISPTRFGCTVIGPAAVDLLQRVGLPAPPSAAPNTLSLISHPWKQGSTIDLLAAHSPLVPRFELWADEATRNAILTDLARNAADLNGGPVDPSALEHLRLLEGTPRFGTDIREKTLAQETDQTRALHFSKGCYLGQEIVERIRSRGNVHRTLAAFRLEGPTSPVGTAILAEGKPVAELTSVAAIPLSTGVLQLGLGIARREAIDRANPLTYTVESGHGLAVPVALPVAQSAKTPSGLPRITHT